MVDLTLVVWCSCTGQVGDSNIKDRDGPKRSKRSFQAARFSPRKRGETVGLAGLRKKIAGPSAMAEFTLVADRIVRPQGCARRESDGRVTDAGAASDKSFRKGFIIGLKLLPRDADEVTAAIPQG